MLKHVGRVKKNKRKVIVAYRTIPGDALSCICVTTDVLEAGDHDTLMGAVESNAGQAANEFADVMARTALSDGSNMLKRFHLTGKMMKFPTSEIEMTPDLHNTVSLDELNKIIAEQKGVSIEDLAIKDETQETISPKKAEVPIEDNLVAKSDEVLSDEQIAMSYRSQADKLFKEAKRLREEAEKLVPSKKKKTTKESAEI